MSAQRRARKYSTGLGAGQSGGYVELIHESLVRASDCLVCTPDDLLFSLPRRQSKEPPPYFAFGKRAALPHATSEVDSPLSQKNRGPPDPKHPEG